MRLFLEKGKIAQKLSALLQESASSKFEFDTASHNMHQRSTTHTPLTSYR
jgi:hypothetical protein